MLIFIVRVNCIEYRKHLESLYLSLSISFLGSNLQVDFPIATLFRLIPIKRELYRIAQFNNKKNQTKPINTCIQQLLRFTAKIFLENQKRTTG